MTSAKQVAANQSNAQHSTGPRTAEGKAISRLNAVQHALTGQLTIVAPQQFHAFLEVSHRLTTSLNPAGEQELQVAARIVRDTWRLSRAAANEDNVYALDLENALAEDNAEDIAEDKNDQTATGPIPDSSPASGNGIEPAIIALTQARTYFERIRDFDRAGLYEQRLKRGLHNDYALFRQLQIDRKHEETNQVTRPRPSVVAKPAPSNGSVLSTPPAVPYNCPDDEKVEPQVVNSTHPYVPRSQRKPAPPPPDVQNDPFWAC